MKLLTTNFLTCAVKTCKTTSASFPLHFKDASLERTDLPFQPQFMRNILPRVNWEALTTTANELGLGSLLPDQNPVDVVLEMEEQEHVGKSGVEESEEVGGEGGSDVEMSDKVVEGSNGKSEVDEGVLRKLHGLLLETAVVEGKLVCGNCGFEYPIKDGVGNFLLPAHLV